MAKKLTREDVPNCRMWAFDLEDGEVHLVSLDFPAPACWLISLFTRF